MAHVHRPGFTVFFGFDPVRINDNCGWLSLPALAYPLDERFKFFFLAKKCMLSLKGRLKLMGQSTPLFTGCGFQVTE